ncbi:MAG TPA: hypothetical protein DCZ75_19980 [Geobacter sp.]|nr:hypothetical protein [Geobacter sp.]
MNKPLDLVSTVISPLIFLLLAAGSVAAAEGEPIVVSPEAEPQLLVEESTLAPEEERRVDVLEQKGGSLGFNFVFSDGFGGRALEYGSLESSRSGGLFYRHLEKESNLELEGFFLNENDYHGDLLLDYRGDYRLHLRTESLYHNLDRELLFSPNFQFGRADAPGLADYVAEQDPARRYGVGVVQDRAEFRYRLHNYPLHVNLGYWRYKKEGTIQQRFADTAFEGALNTIRAEARGVNQQAQEGRAGLDAHLGPVDLIYDFKVRYFEDRVPTPVALYQARNDVNGSPTTIGGLREHNDQPDSRFLSHTVKLHNSIAGGLVASGSYSVEQRENLSESTEVTGARHARAYVRNAAGDLAFTPCQCFTFALKYRRQELDQGNRGALLSSNFVDPVQTVKPAVDTTKDVVIGTVSYKPRLDLSLVGEYRGEFLNRDNVSGIPSTSTWALPENSETHTGSLAVFYRPFKGFRSSANYSYATTDHPSYGASYQKKHEGKVLATYSRSNSWGVTAHGLFRREQNDEVEHFLVNYPFDPLSYTVYPLTARTRRTENSNVGIWYVPLPRLTLAAHYAYLQNHVDQAVLFTGVISGSEAASEFSSRSHVYGVNATYSMDEKLDMSLMMQQIRSIAAFKPVPTTFTVIPGDTSGVEQLTEQDTVISSLSARAEYRFSRVLSTTLEYSVKDYDEKNVAYSAYDGTVHAVIAGVAAKW